MALKGLSFLIKPVLLIKPIFLIKPIYIEKLNLY